MTTILDNDGKEMKTLLKIGLGKENFAKLNKQVDSTSPIKILRKSGLRELKLRDQRLKTNTTDQASKDLYCDFMDDLTKIVGQVNQLDPTDGRMTTRLSS